MALLTAIACIYGHKHKSQTSNKKFISLLLASVLVYSAIPQSSLAFEVELKNAPARKLVAPIQLLHSENFQKDTNVVYQPEYASRMSATVVARPSVETKAGSWKAQAKLAYVDQNQNYKPKVRPSVTSPVILEGEASYYSRAGCLGCNPMRIMANGQPLNDDAFTMAIGANLKHLVGYRAKVTNLRTSQSVDVLITDTGGFYQAKYGNRVADLTIATKQAIGINGGVGQVRVEVY